MVLRAPADVVCSAAPPSVLPVLWFQHDQPRPLRVLSSHQRSLSGRRRCQGIHDVRTCRSSTTNRHAHTFFNVSPAGAPPSGSPGRRASVRTHQGRAPWSGPAGWTSGKASGATFITFSVTHTHTHSKWILIKEIPEEHQT